MTGAWPAADIDHKDMVRTNNRWDNLREANDIQNGQNRTVYANNRCGLKGVSWNSRAGKWLAGVTVNKKRIELGFFETPEEAHTVYAAAAIKYFGEFARVS